MGSKSPDHEYQRNYRDSSNSEKPSNVDGGSKGLSSSSHASRDGDGCLEDGGGQDDDDDHDDDIDAAVTERVENDIEVSMDPSSTAVPTSTDLGETRKKRKKSNKKKKKQSAPLPTKQSFPPRILLSNLFPSGDYPLGEVQYYKSKSSVSSSSLTEWTSTARTTATEIRYDDRQQYWKDDVFLRNYRKAAEAHRQARQWVHDSVKPGHTLLDIAVGIEDSVRALLGHAGLESGDGLKAGMGFPTGLSLNHQVAHYTPNPGQKTVVLQQQDVMKVDFGVHVNGWIVDSAFTLSFDPTYDNLLAAVKDATNTGIKTTGIDVRISDVSAAIQETMESYEVEIRGRTFPVKPVRNITAHDIKHFRIHGGKSIPFVKTSDQTKMEEGEVFAIETFGTTGRGYVHDDVGIYGYGLNEDVPLSQKSSSLPLASAKRLHKTIRDNFGTLVFCRRYLDRLGTDSYLAGMNCLVSNGIVEAYRPLTDVKGSYSAQFEHTLLLRESHKEVLSRGDDY